MKAIILAAGQGTRLKKYTENLPKGMLSFMGKTLIERQIELYRKCGVQKISIVRGFAADKIHYSGVQYYDNKDYETTNMVESLMAARAEFQDDIIVSYSDILFEEQMLRQMINAEGDIAIAVDDNWKAYWKKRYGRVDFDTESLTIDSKDRVLELGFENPRIEEIDARYIGLLKFSKAGLVYVESVLETAYKRAPDEPWQQSGRPVRQAYMTDLLQALIQSGRTVRAEHFHNGWLEFDTNEDYEKACEWSEEQAIRQLIKI